MSQDLDIDRLSGQVQQAMEAFYAEPSPERLFFWERLAKKLWSLEQTRRRDRIAGGMGDPCGGNDPIWRGPQDRVNQALAGPR